MQSLDVSLRRHMASSVASHYSQTSIFSSCVASLFRRRDYFKYRSRDCFKMSSLSSYTIIVASVLICICQDFFKCTDLSFQLLGSPYYALLNFSSQDSCTSQDLAVNITAESASTSQENGASATYQNLTDEGNPVPGLSRGVVPHRSYYINTRPTASWYNKLQLIRPLAMEWLRNAWGNVDQSGHHTYDVMQRDQHVSSPYDKLHQTTERDVAESSAPTSSNLYNTLERPAAVLLPSRCQNASTTEDV